MGGGREGTMGRKGVTDGEIGAGGESESAHVYLALSISRGLGHVLGLLHISSCLILTTM